VQLEFLGSSSLGVFSVAGEDEFQNLDREVVAGGLGLRPVQAPGVRILQI